MRISVGTRLFLSILAIFLAFIFAILAYLHFDIQLSSTLRDDYLFLWFGIFLIVVLVVTLLLFSLKVDRSLTAANSEENAHLRRQLTQNISHELKTPVASVQGYLETILDNPDMPEETRRTFLERSLSQTRRLSALLIDLSVLNRLDESDALFPFQSIDVVETLSLLSKEKAPALQAKGMSIQMDIPRMIELNGNEALIYSLFRNLLDNALMYAGDGAVITISAYRDGPFWRFTFADNGPGVPEEDLGRLFERFYRVDKGRSRANGGTGLGLSIVKNAVRRHGGTITATSNNPGLRFDFTLKR